MTTPVSISVTFRKQISDGNYGSEAAEVVIEVGLSEGDSEGEAAMDALTVARNLVQDELARSPNAVVRRALERQEPRQPRADEL